MIGGGRDPGDPPGKVLWNTNGRPVKSSWLFHRIQAREKSSDRSWRRPPHACDIMGWIRPTWSPSTWTCTLKKANGDIIDIHIPYQANLKINPDPGFCFFWGGILGAEMGLFWPYFAKKKSRYTANKTHSRRFLFARCEHMGKMKKSNHGPMGGIQ